jgi:uncharacterized protein YkwD
MWLIGEALVLAVACTGCFAPSPAGAQDEDTAEAKEAVPCATPEDAEQLADQVLELINLERAKESLQPVVVNEALEAIAGDYACRMADESFFGHEDPRNGYGPAERAVAGKYKYFAIGENLAAGPETAAQVMRLWMQSDTHRAVILDPCWKEVGIAARVGGEYGTYWVQEFGDPADY